ncbi:MAG: outer membrane protein assembly factor BamD [Candidatus Aminicenantes bacterium]
MRKAFLIFAISFLSLMISSNCKKEKTEISPEVASSDEALFKLGQEYLDKDPEKARLYLRQVIDSFPKSFYAQRAKLAIADSYFEKGDEGSMILAASEYREFISLFPLSPSAAYAQYQIGMTYFEKALKPGRDQTKTRQALAEFKKVITNYPLSEEAELAQEKIEECEERLAEHTFSIGELYYKMGAYKAAVSRLKEILTQYPNYSKMDEVYYHLADSYYKWKKVEESVPYFTKLISDFPESDYAKKAQHKLKEIEEEEK